MKPVAATLSSCRCELRGACVEGICGLFSGLKRKNGDQRRVLAECQAGGPPYS